MTTSTLTRSPRARVPLDPPTGWFARWIDRLIARRFGGPADPLRAMWHNPRVLRADLALEAGVSRLRTLPPHLGTLAQMTAAVQIECGWCLDFGYFLAHAQGVEPAKLEQVPTWRTSDAFTPLERRVMEFAEAATATPPAVTDGMAAALRADLGDDGLVELTMLVAVENLRSRFNSTLGLSSQGFSESCRVPGA
ncbi:carboxymuconolactone decarboxylase family protein [Nakamurella sp.]|uniref:carboxymuconolactone decarboxylase family protein n=1 Tax=Nakamurella sp. TaxID=1869182 RepID=UPI003B3B5639